MLEKPVESVALHILEEPGYQLKRYPRLLADDAKLEPIRLDVLRDRLLNLNPELPAELYCGCYPHLAASTAALADAQ